LWRWRRTTRRFARGLSSACKRPRNRRRGAKRTLGSTTASPARNSFGRSSVCHFWCGSVPARQTDRECESAYQNEANSPSCV
jgi:hypothetical protein